MENPQITKVSFSTINKKWYLQINNLIDIETTENDAMLIIHRYQFEEINPFQYFPSVK